MPIAPDTLERLAANAERADRGFDWPRESWRVLCASGVPRWSVPAEYGGEGRPASEVLAASEALASACLTTAFILSQREAAVRRILSGPAELARRVLPAATAGEHYLTVGLSQLTTSRQHLGPSLRATPRPGGYRLDGEVPWVTGADVAAAVVVGATLPDESQVLLVLPAGRAGVVPGPPLDLAALAGSRTALVHCEGVFVESDWLLAGPSPRVLGGAGGGGLETSYVALGLVRAAVASLQEQCQARPELAEVAARLAAERDHLREVAAAGPDADAVLALRADCTLLALRATQAALVAAKGAGFVAPHPAQRWARQALFLLVWSCPRSVTERVLAGLAGTVFA